MMIIKTTGGDIFRGKDAKGVVRAMKQTQWNAPDAKRDYIKQVADRVEQMTGVRPRRGADKFLSDLAGLGLVTVVDGADDTQAPEEQVGGAEDEEADLSPLRGWQAAAIATGIVH